MDNLEKELQEIIKKAKKEGDVISEEDLGERLINFELNAEELKTIKMQLEEQGITVEDAIEETIKDEDLKEIISNVKVDDPVKMYLKDIGQAQLLTAEQEVELAKKILDGDVRARKELSERNLKLVVSIAKKIC